MLFIVLNSVTSTPQWIRQPEPRDIRDVCFKLEPDERRGAAKVNG